MFATGCLVLGKPLPDGRPRYDHHMVPIYQKVQVYLLQSGAITEEQCLKPVQQLYAFREVPHV